MTAPGLDITHRSDLPAVVARWQREITAAELQAGYQAILNAADTCGCWRWLLDLRRRDEVASPALDEWIDNVFLPQLVRRFECPVRLAFLISPLRAQHTAPTDSADIHPIYDYYLATFIDEAAAYAWLAQ
jgi:hypothetical protein